MSTSQRIGWRSYVSPLSSLLTSIYGVWNAETTSTTLATSVYSAWNGEGIITPTQLSASMSNAWQGGAGSFPATNYAAITTSMSNLWKAENNTTDSIGGLVGTSPSGSAPTFTTGKLGTSAFLFDGVNDFIKLPVGSLQFTGDFTISLWFKPSTLRNGDILLSNYSLRSSDYNRFGWEIRLGNGSKYQFTQANNSVYNATLEASVGPVAGVWQLLTIVRTAATSKMYVNGSLVGQVANTISLAYNANSVPTIGAETYITWSDNTTSTSSFFNGAIDEIGMWTRGLSNNEVIGLYEAGNGQTYPYSNSTTVLSDSYGTNHGIMRGVTYSTGKIGNALLFNGSSYVDLPVGALDKTSDFSVSLWIYPTANNTMTLISSFDGQKGWQIQYLSGNLWFWGSNGSLGGTQTIQVQTGHSIVLNTWTHLLVTVKNSVQVKTYINGVLTNTVSTTGKPITYNYYSPYYLPLIGAKRYFDGMSGNAANSEFFTGKLDGIGLWDRELTADEASAIYNSGNGNEYPFSNASVSSPADSVSTNHGTNVGGVTYTTGVLGNAFTFNGSNYINLPNNSLNSTVGNDFSVSLWVNFTSTSNQGLITNLTNPSVNYYTGWDLRLTSGLPTFEMWNNSGSATIVQGSAISINNWYHIVITRKKGSRSRIYMNGSLVQSNTNTSDPTISSTYYPNIGHYQYLSTNGASTATYHGLYMASGSKIDAVTVWNKELAEDEITQLYNMGGGIQYPFTTQTIKTPYAVYNGDNLIDPIGAKNATIVGGVTYSVGKIGNAYTFDGTTGYLTLPVGSLNLAGSFSFSMWLYFNGTPTGYNTIISNLLTGNYRGFQLAVISGNLYIQLGNGSGTWVELQGPTVNEFTNKWGYVTFVWEQGVGMKFYLNGVLHNSGANTTTLSYTGITAAPMIGKRVEGGWSLLKGSIDGLTFWNSALTAPEVLTMFNDGTGMEYPYSSTLPAKLPSYGDTVNTNHGTSPSGSAPGFSVGKIGKAFRFDGVNDYVQLPNNSLNFPSTSFSVSFWVNLANITSGNYALVSNYANDGVNRGWIVGSLTSGKLYFGIYAPGIQETVTSATIAINTWYHVTCVYTPNQPTKTYINGTLDSTSSTSYNPSYTTTHYPSIGASKYNSSSVQQYVSNGTKIDALSVWNKQLTATEVTDLYNSGNGKQYPNY